jgi:hypothetical protein
MCVYIGFLEVHKLNCGDQGCGVGVGILGGVGVGKYVPTPTPTSIYNLGTRYSKSRTLIATVTIRLILKNRFKFKNWPDDSRGGDEMSYRFIIINTY